MVFEHEGEHASQWAPISSIAAKIGLRARGRAAPALRLDARDGYLTAVLIGPPCPPNRSKITAP
jgi:hypothetical protein